MIVILIIIGIIISFFNIYTVNTGETAVITRFGKVVRTEQAGLHVKINVIAGKGSTKEDTSGVESYDYVVL